MMNGEIWWVDFEEPFGSEPGFKRPAVVLQNNELNQSGINTFVVVPLTTNIRLEDYQGNVFVSSEVSNLPKDSVAIGTLITSVDKNRFIEKTGKLQTSVFQEVLDAVNWVIGGLNAN